LKADHNECTRAQKPEKENIKKVKVDASFASRVGENLLFSIQTRERERERWERKKWTSMVYGPCLHKSMQCMYVCMYVCIGEAVKG
jgi:hypothetical protein